MEEDADYTQFEDNGTTAAARNSPLVLIKADNLGVTTVTSLLKTINFCEKVNVFISDAGVRFTVEEGKYVQAVLFLKAELFRTFNCNEEAFGFKIPFKELLDCLKILGGDSKSGAGTNETTDATAFAAAGAPGGSRSMQITYNGYGSPFSLSLEENGMLTEIELKTEESDVLIDFDEYEKRWDLTMDSKVFYEHLLEIDGYHPESVVLRVVPNTHLEFKANGSAGSLQITIPKKCTGIEKFCTIAQEQHARYKFSIFKYCYKLIQAAEKVIIQMSDTDILSFRLVFRESMATFAQFHIIALAGQDSDDLDVD